MLPREYKLKRDNDFKKVFKQGKYYRGNFIGIKFLRNSLESNQFAFIVSLKISKKAVIRNKIRRQLEEVVRLNFDQIKKGFNIVVMVDPQIIKEDYQKIEKELLNIFKKIELIN